MFEKEIDAIAKAIVTVDLLQKSLEI